jgi:integrase
LDKSTVSELVQRFVDERMQDGGERRGAAEDRGHIPALKGDAIGTLPLSKLTPASVREFRDRQIKAGFAKGTVVKRMNLLAAIISYARAEWDIPLTENAASGESVKRPKGADKKRNRRLRAPSSSAIQAALDAGEEPPKHEEQRMLDALKGTPYKHDVLITRWAIAQAMRQGESWALLWGDIDLERKIVEVHGRHREGVKTSDDAEELGPELRPLMPEALTILREIMGDRKPKPGEHVFDVGPQQAFKVRWGRMIAKAGLVDLCGGPGFLDSRIS